MYGLSYSKKNHRQIVDCYNFLSVVTDDCVCDSWSDGQPRDFSKKLSFKDLCSQWITGGGGDKPKWWQGRTKEILRRVAKYNI